MQVLYTEGFYLEDNRIKRYIKDKIKQFLHYILDIVEPPYFKPVNQFGQLQSIGKITDKRSFLTLMDLWEELDSHKYKVIELEKAILNKTKEQENNEFLKLFTFNDNFQFSNNKINDVFNKKVLKIIMDRGIETNIIEVMELPKQIAAKCPDLSLYEILNNFNTLLKLAYYEKISYKDALNKMYE